MTDFRPVAAGFAVAGQLSLEDVSRAAAEGFTTIVKNRPDAEDPNVPSEAEMKAAAAKAGLGFQSLPFSGPPPPAVVAEMAMLLDRATGPVLAYCRTGQRSITAWAMAQALSGALRPKQIIEMASRAGYDLSSVRAALETLAPPV
jgi:uncharacterized protein (TIGR01244 family)